MCLGCYIEEGMPWVSSDAVRHAASAVARLYEVTYSGANAHIVTDDWNIDDEHVGWCLNQPKQDWLTDDEYSRGRAALIALKPLSVEERASALALYEFKGVEDNLTQWRNDRIAEAKRVD